MPITLAFGQRLTRSSVELPGPQPISTTLRGSSNGICASRSRDGRVRSSSNLRYCSALQSVMAKNFAALRYAPLACQFLVFHPMRDDAVLAEPSHLVLLVILKIALEPFDVAVVFERQDVGRDAVEEPAVVADDDGAAGKVLQRLFERAQGVDVEIVGRLVEQQDVGTRLQH